MYELCITAVISDRTSSGTADITGDLKLKEGTEMVMPGDNTTLDVELITPVPMEAGLRFNMREGGRTVGTGIVTKIIE